jgi:hypothetical protein
MELTLKQWYGPGDVVKDFSTRLNTFRPSSGSIGSYAIQFKISIPIPSFFKIRSTRNPLVRWVQTLVHPQFVIPPLHRNVPKYTGTTSTFFQSLLAFSVFFLVQQIVYRPNIFKLDQSQSSFGGSTLYHSTIALYLTLKGNGCSARTIRVPFLPGDLHCLHFALHFYAVLWIVLTIVPQDQLTVQVGGLGNDTPPHQVQSW